VIAIQFRQAALIAACLVWTLLGEAVSQVPPVREQFPAGILPDVRQWESIGAVSTARQILHTKIHTTSRDPQDAAFSFEVLKTAYQTQDYEASYYIAASFVENFPGDRLTPDALFMEGVSAAQTGRTDTALTALTLFLTGNPGHELKSLAQYWRARCRLEQRNWHAAELDFEQCALDSSAHTHSDDALLGLALAKERHGDYQNASATIRRLLNDYPYSDLLNDARIRLASLKLRLGDPRGALVLLAETKTPYRYQREESLLLRGEANFQMGLFDSARVRYERFIQDFPQSRHIRNAKYGLAWAYLKLGQSRQAQSLLDHLGNSNDTLALTALYQSAVIALLSNDTKDASARFDSLVQVFPYEQYSDNAYYELGLIAYRSQHYREARKYFQLAARLYPESEIRFQAYRMMGEACQAISDFSNAQYSFSQVRKLGAPDSILAPSLFQEGVALYHLGRFRSSVDRFEDFLHRFASLPLAGEAYVWKAEALYQDYRFDEAERSYFDALKLFPNNPKRQAASYGYAWSLFEQKKFNKAVDAFDAFIKSYPQSNARTEALLRKADCYYFLGEYSKSEELYASLTAQKSEGRSAEYAAFQIAMSYLQRGDADRGIEQLRGFVNRYPGSIYAEVAVFNIAWTYFSKEQYTAALTEFQAFIRQYPGSQLLPRVYFNMGDAFYNIKSYDSARVYYTSVLGQYPQSPLAADALSGLEFTYRAEGKTGDALSAIEKYVTAKPAGANQEDMILKKADILFDQSDFPGAIQEYQRVLSLKPGRTQQTRALQQIGRAYELENNPSQAITYYQQIVNNFADADAAPSIALALGHTHIKLKQFSQAKDVFTEFEQKFPASPLVPEAQYQLGMTLLEMKDSSGGLTQFQSVIRRNSTDIFAERSRLQIASYHQRKRQYQASIDTLEGVVTRRNDDLAAEALLIIGDDYLFMKRNGDALQAFLDIIEQYPEFAIQVERAKLGAGDAYTRLAEKKKAKKLYQEIIAAPVNPDMKKEAETRLRRLR